MKSVRFHSGQSRITSLFSLALSFGALSSLAAAPLILDVVETGGDNEATDTIVAQWTGQTFISGIANEPLPNTAADAPYTVGFFQEASPAFVDRNHRYTQASTTLPIPGYLLGAEYIMSGNDNRDNNDYQLDITVSRPCIVYMLVDNRMPDGKANTSAPIFGTTRDSNMGWLPLDGFTGVFSGINRDAGLDRPDEIGIDESADGAGPGLGIPGDDLSNLNNISAEIATYLNLEPGVYRLGVNSDDGFKVTAGKGDPRDPTGVLLGEFNAGRGAANSIFYVNVEAAGYYPVRLLYFEGGGGASLEFFSVDVNTGEFRLINDTTDPLAIRAYSAPTVKRPFASVSPIHNAVNVAPNASLQAQIFDQTATVTQPSIRLELNGTAVTPSISKAGSVTTVLHQPADYLPPGTNFATLVYADNGTPSLSVTNSWQFVVEDYANYPVIPAAFAAPAGTVDLNSSGFLVDSYSMAVGRTGFADANSYPAAEQQLARGYIDPATSQPYANLFTAGSVDGKHPVTLVNWNQNAPANAGNFTAANINPDALIPGQPAAGDSNNIVAEAIGFVELKQGYYQLGVNSDDGFRVTTAPNFKDVAALQLGLFNAGRGAADTLFSFFVEADGIYPIRLLWWEGTGGASCEFFIAEPATGARRLINDRVNTAYFSVDAYATYTGPERPFLKSITPANGAVDQLPNVTIEAVIGSLGGGSIKLTVNGTEVTPTVTPQGADTLVTYTPAQPYASGATVTAVLEYDGIPATVTFMVEGSSSTAPLLGNPTVTDGNVTITWTGAGTLEYTDELGTGWTTTGDSDGDYTEAATQPHRFYRVRQ